MLRATLRDAGIIVTIAVNLLAAAVLAWEFIPLEYSAWDGGLDLSVTVTCDAGPLRSVSCRPSLERFEAECVLEDPFHREWQTGRVDADPFDGKPLVVYVPITGRDSPTGREIYRRQYRFLAVTGILQDGSKLSKIVDIPDLRRTREINVSLP